MTDKELSLRILENIGGKENVVTAVNCMTRLRFLVRDSGAVKEDALNSLEGVLHVKRDAQGHVEVVVAPGRSRRCMAVLRAEGLQAAVSAADTVQGAGMVTDGKLGRLKGMVRTFAGIFSPLIPGVIAAGICAGLASMITQLVPWHESSAGWTVVINLLNGINSAFMLYLTAWAGYRAAETFGGTPILGGMIGMFTTLSNVDTIAEALGLFNKAEPLNAILRAGRGGMLAAIAGVWLMCRIERFLRRKMPSAMDVVFTPLLTLLATLIPYLFLVMPLLGFVSSGICKLVGLVALNSHPLVRMFAGFLSAALFLPMVAMGMHHGLIALYTVQLDSLGYITLYPALAMAGAGQVGAALAIALKARKRKDRRLLRTIAGAVPAGLLGVGEPLIYGVTLPLGKPFVTAGLGAGLGGAFVMLMEVASTTWGPSGLLGIFVMTEGPRGPAASVLCYLIGLLISCIGGFLFTAFSYHLPDGVPAVK